MSLTLLEAVAQDVGGLAARDDYAPHAEPLLTRTMRIRVLLHAGPGDDHEPVG